MEVRFVIFIPLADGSVVEANVARGASRFGVDAVEAWAVPAT